MRPTYEPSAEAYREKVQAFLAEKLPSNWSGIGSLEGSAIEEFVAEWRQTLFEAGYLAPGWPVEFGGAGLSALEQVILAEEFARAGVPTGGPNDVFGIQMLGNTLLLMGSDEQKERYLPRILSGADTWCQGYSEPNAGSDVMSLKLRATEDGDGYRLNGRKFWITNGPSADVLIVYATLDPALGTKGVTAFLIERGDAGFSCAQKLDKLGMRGSETGELVFDDCWLPKDRVPGALGGGAAVLMGGLDYERIVLAGGPLGLMAAALDCMAPYLQTREQFGQPIGQFQLMQGKLADCYVALNSARSYVYAVARAADRGKTTRFDAAGCILYASEAATRVALETIQALGGNGYTNDYPAGRLLRDAKLYEIGAGTNEIRRMLMGRELLRP